MMAEFEIDFKGVKEFDREIKKLTGPQIKKVIRTGLKKGGAVIIKEAKQNLPPDYDTLRRSMRSAFRKPKTKFYQTLKIGFTIGSSAKYNGWFAHIVEGGADAHEIESKNGKLLNAGDDIVTTRINHPGIVARPFFRPAFESKSQAVLKKFTTTVWAGIKANIKK